MSIITMRVTAVWLDATLLQTMVFSRDNVVNRLYFTPARRDDPRRTDRRNTQHRPSRGTRFPCRINAINGAYTTHVYNVIYIICRVKNDDVRIISRVCAPGPVDGGTIRYWLRFIRRVKTLHAESRRTFVFFFHYTIIQQFTVKYCYCTAEQFGSKMMIGSTRFMVDRTMMRVPPNCICPTIHHNYWNHFQSRYCKT